ncbi:hypothetical protein ACIBH1_22095 [Nonomuraea sp. NPDC050663]|uniref:hypothetical protein n=1 Tax=Nonomuraea sp. NPDC050663 TaxID=3364370 RepID=UPI0037A670FF
MTTYHAKRDHLWFLRNRNYTVFVARELTSVFVAWTIVYLMLVIDAGGPPSFAGEPWMIAINVVAFAATAFHAITFLNLAPKATVVRLDGWRVPAFMIQGGNHSAWLVVSGIIAFLVLKGV